MRGEQAIARKRKPPVAAPREARKVVVALTIAEVALALLLTWLLFRSDVAKHASRSIRLGAADLLVLSAMAACLAVYVFVLLVWQWRLSGRARVRLLLVMFVSMLWSFCGLCWHDVSLRAAELARGPAAPTALEQIREQTAAVAVTMGALLVGLVVVIAVIWVARLTAEGEPACEAA